MNIHYYSKAERTAYTSIMAIGPSNSRINILASALAVSGLSRLHLNGTDKDFRKHIETIVRPQVEGLFNTINNLSPLDFEEAIEITINIIKAKHANMYANATYMPMFIPDQPEDWIHNGSSYFSKEDYKLLGTKLGHRLTKIYRTLLDEQEGSQ